MLRGDPAIAARAEHLAPALASIAFIREDRAGKVFIESTPAGEATVVSAYSSRVRLTPGDFTPHTPRRR